MNASAIVPVSFLTSASLLNHTVQLVGTLSGELDEPFFFSLLSEGGMNDAAILIQKNGQLSAYSLNGGLMSLIETLQLT